MSRAEPTTAAKVHAGWRQHASTAAALHHLSPWLVLAVIAQESAGDTFAYRAEPQFLESYRNKIESNLEHVRNLEDRKRYLRWWRRDPMVFATSFGAMQPLVIVAVELGFSLTYPTTLCDPALGLDVGCKKLRQCFTQTATATEPIRAALLRYNGGAAREYPDEVLAWQDALMAAGSQPKGD